LPKLSQPFPKPKHEVRRFGDELRSWEHLFLGELGRCFLIYLVFCLGYYL